MLNLFHLNRSSGRISFSYILFFAMVQLCVCVCVCNLGAVVKIWYKPQLTQSLKLWNYIASF